MLIRVLLPVEHFQSELGSVYMADAALEPVELRLIRVEPEPRGPQDKRVPFTLTFANPREERLEKGYYTLRSENGPEFRHVLLTPLPPTGEIQQYLARI